MKTILIFLAITALFTCMQIQDSEQEHISELQAINDDLQKLVGEYDVSKDCDSWECDRTSLYSHSNNFCCPKAGNNAFIKYDTNKQVYFIDFKTFNLFWGDSKFFASFTQQNVVKTSNGNEIRIPMNGGYVMNIIPCYHGEKTNEVCRNKSPYFELAVYKSRPNQKHPYLDSCTFSMTKVL